MKVLILTCNTGEGHNSSAAAIREELALEGIPCDILDSLSLISPKISGFIGSWHSRIYRYAPAAFRKGYAFTEKHEALFSKNTPVYRGLARGVERLYRQIRMGGYDTVVCVHVFSALMVTELRSRYPAASFTAAFVGTDYTCSPSTATSRLDIYYIPHEGLADEFAARGVPREKLIPVGIPLRRDFYEPIDRETARRREGLAPGQRHVLLMCGSMGAGRVETLAREIAVQLPPGTLLTTVCGRNEKLYARLTSLSLPSVRVLGFTKEVPLLMSSADLFITKPGGISITEAAVKALPMLFVDMVGGCELRNLQYFLHHRWAEQRGTPPTVALRCRELLEDPTALDEMSARLNQAFPESAARLLCRHLAAAGQTPPASEAQENGKDPVPPPCPDTL